MLWSAKVKIAALILAFLFVIAVLVLLLSRRAAKPQIGEIAPAHVLQEKYGLYAENRPEVNISPERVPQNLRDLIPIAEKWGINDDIIRDDFEENASQEDKDDFVAALKGRTKDVTRWLDSLAEGQPMSDEAAHFMFMLEALDEMGLWPD